MIYSFSFSFILSAPPFRSCLFSWSWCVPNFFRCRRFFGRMFFRLWLSSVVESLSRYKRQQVFWLFRICWIWTSFFVVCFWSSIRCDITHETCEKHLYIVTIANLFVTNLFLKFFLVFFCLRRNTVAFRNWKNVHISITSAFNWARSTLNWSKTKQTYTVAIVRRHSMRPVAVASVSIRQRNRHRTIVGSSFAYRPPNPNHFWYDDRWRIFSCWMRCYIDVSTIAK